MKEAMSQLPRSRTINELKNINKKNKTLILQGFQLILCYNIIIIIIQERKIYYGLSLW
jgi:hypothetical protein